MISERILDVFHNLELDEPLDEKEILNADYVEDEIFDSITFVMLIVALEDEFGIEIEGENILIENLSSFNAIENLIIDLLQEKSNEWEKYWTSTDFSCRKR